MLAEPPEWLGGSSQSSAAAADGRGVKRRQEELVANARDGTRRGGGGSLQRELVEVLAKLSLSNAQELRDLTSMSYFTVLTPASAGIAIAMADAGRTYHDRTVAIKQGDAGQQRDQQLAALGPPHLHIWAAVVKYMATTTDKITQATKESFVAYWNEVVTKNTVEKLSETVQLCRARKAFYEEKPGRTRMVKIQWSLDIGRDPFAKRLEGPLLEALISQGGIRKIGPPPRSGLERDAQRLLDRLNEE